MKKKITKFLEGQENREKCIHDMILENDCETKCFPGILDFLPNMTLCTNENDFSCNLYRFNPKIAKCINV